MSQPEFKVYQGNCHCGAFKFELTIPELKVVAVCGCSICSKKGYLWIDPAADQLKVIKGEGILTSYEFGTRTMSHKVSSAYPMDHDESYKTLY